MKKFAMSTLFFFIAAMLFSSIASAHVVVYPRDTTQGSYEKFTVRVPNEKDINTVKVEVKFQTDNVTVSRFDPKPFWKYEIAQNAEGVITGVTWTATEGGLSKTEFTEFNMSGKVGDNAASITWMAYQTYEDGSVVAWDGAAGSDKPASVTNVKAATGQSDGHGHDNGAAAAPAEDHQDEESNDVLNYITLAISIIAIIISAAALFRLGRKRA